MNALRFLLPAAVIFAAVSPADAFLFDEKTNSTVEVKPVFSGVPPTGCMPVRVEIRNQTGKDVTCGFSFTATAPGSSSEDHTFTSKFTCSGGKDQTSVHSLIVPLFPDLSDSSGSSSYGYSSRGGGNLRWKETEVSSGNENGSAGNVVWIQDMPFTALSGGLAASTLPVINGKAAVISSGSSRGGSRGTDFAVNFEARYLPEDWRAFSGVDVLALTADEWVGLNAGVQLALRQWVISGGNLDIYHTGGAPAFEALRIKSDRPAESKNAVLLGTGVVRLVSWDGAELGQGASVDSTVARYNNPGYYGLRQSYNTEAQSGTSSPLSLALGDRAFAAWQVGIILLIFGVLVGPVNLFKFAGPGRRHRLFFTTPIISLAASLILIAVIFFQDGTGGTGRRVGVIHLRGGENIAYLRQDQISRTGVLFGSSFKPAEPSVVQPLLLGENRWRRLKRPENYGYPPRGGGDSHRLTEEDGTFAGDWFQSRSEQAQTLVSMRTTRGRVDLVPGTGEAAPGVNSSLPCSLERLFYTDPAGKIWCSPGEVARGQTVTLSASSEEEFEGWLLPQLSRVSVPLRKELELEAARPGCFVASSGSAEAGLLDTLSSVKWVDDFVILHGPL